MLPLDGARFADLAVASSVTPTALPNKVNTSVTLTLQVTNTGPNRARQVAVFSELLQKKYQDKLGEEASRLIQFTVNAAHRMESLINDLLAYTQAADAPQAATASTGLAALNIFLFSRRISTRAISRKTAATSWSFDSKCR